MGNGTGDRTLSGDSVESDSRLHKDMFNKIYREWCIHVVDVICEF